jgi:hypothetical protein
VGGGQGSDHHHVVIPTTGSERRSDVNAYTTIYVQAHIDELHAEAASERLARNARTSAANRNRLADAVKSVWSLLNAPIERPMTMPTLSDYPFRS